MVGEPRKGLSHNLGPPFRTTTDPSIGAHLPVIYLELIRPSHFDRRRNARVGQLWVASMAGAATPTLIV